MNCVVTFISNRTYLLALFFLPARRREGPLGQGRDGVEFYTEKKVVVERWARDHSRKF